MINRADTDWTHAFMRVLGDEIRRVRKARGWTREGLRDRLDDNDISLQTLATYELGTRKITVVRLVDITETLGTTAAEVLRRTCERLSDEPAAAMGWTIDLPAAANLDAAELAPLARWANLRLAELPDYRTKTAWLTRPALQALAVLCGLEPKDLVGRLPRRDLPA